MSDLDAAIAAEMKRQGCDRYDFDSDIPEVSSETTCEQHEAVWDEDRDACMVVAESVTAGWDAAINAAAGRLDALFHSERDRIKKPIRETDKAYYLDGIAVAEDAVRALLSEGGGRD